MDEGMAEALLIDAPSRDLYGGTGQTFDWSNVRGLDKKIIIAGGLDATNVRRAIHEAQPWGVDACSRLEKSPGLKDHVKVRQFVLAALEAE
jgi:phosphoribosylanthranilate isomerase